MSEATLKLLLLGEDKSASKAIRGVGTEATQTGGKLKSFGKIAAGVFTGLLAQEAVRKVGEFLKGSVEAAMEDEAAQRKLATALKNTTGATNDQIAGVESWISRQSLATGVADDELRPALQRLAESTGSVSKAQSELGLAMDVSAGTGKSLEAVSTALMKANNGSVSGLARLGIKTKDAAGETLNLREALKSMSETFKGQAEVRARSMQGQMDRLKVAWQETKEAVGAKLLPVLMRLGNWFFQKGIPALKAMSESVGSTLGPAFGKLREALGKLEGPFHAVIGFIKDNPQTAKAFAVALGVMTVALMAGSVAMWALSAAMDANPIGLIVIAIAALAAGLVYAYTHSEKFRAVVQAMGEALKWLGGAIAWVIGFVKDHWKEILVALVAPFAVAVYEIHKHWDRIKQIVAAAIPIIVAFVKSLPGKMLAALKVLGPKLWDLIRTVWSKWIDIERELAEKAWQLVKSLPGKYVGALKVLGPLLWDVIKWAFRKLLDAQQWGIGKAVDLARAAPGKIAAGIKALGGLLWDLAKGAFDRFVTAEGNGITRVIAAVKGLPGKIVSAIGDLGSLLFQKGKDLIEGFIRGMLAAPSPADIAHSLINKIPGVGRVIATPGTAPSAGSAADTGPTFTPVSGRFARAAAAGVSPAASSYGIAAGQTAYGAAGYATTGVDRATLVEIEGLRDDLQDLTKRLTDDTRGGIALSSKTTAKMQAAVEAGARAGVGDKRNAVAARRLGGGV